MRQLSLEASQAGLLRMERKRNFAGRPFLQLVVSREVHIQHVESVYNKAKSRNYVTHFRQESWYEERLVLALYFVSLRISTERNHQNAGAATL